MEITPEKGRASSLSPRVALLSIVGFWLFYFAIVTVRSIALGFEDQLGMLPRRALVVAVCVAITFLLYLCIRRTAPASLRRSILVIALLAIPAAIIYSAVNHYAFSGLYPKKKGAKVIIQKPAVELPEPPGMIERGQNGVPTPPAPPEPPAVVTVQVGHEGDWDESEPTAVGAIADQAANGYFFFIAWAALYLALRYAAEAVAAERRAAAFRSAAQIAELRALRYQVNPHFLFNTLNSLSSLILGDRRDEAEKVIMNLATFFRTSLTSDPTEDVMLAEEVRLQRLYLDIEAVRFPERLRVEIDVPASLLTTCVPGLILQPLVENAIRYGVSRARRPITLTIRAREEGSALVVTVADDGDPLPVQPVEAGHGVGLRNVRERLDARFGDGAGVTWGPLPGGGFAVMLRMPMLRHGC